MIIVDVHWSLYWRELGKTSSFTLKFYSHVLQPVEFYHGDIEWEKWRDAHWSLGTAVVVMYINAINWSGNNCSDCIIEKCWEITGAHAYWHWHCSLTCMIVFLMNKDWLCLELLMWFRCSSAFFLLVY
jgi:hypothetical protein